MFSRDCITGKSKPIGEFLTQGQGEDGGATALGHSGISREPVMLVRDGTDGLEIRLPSSRMVVELNGSEIHATASVTCEQIESGVILGMGRTVLLCLHWMRGRPFIRHLLVAPQPSYRSAYLPRIWNDVDRNDRGEVPAHEAEVVAAFDRAAEILREATALIDAGR